MSPRTTTWSAAREGATLALTLQDGAEGERLEVVASATDTRAHALEHLFDAVRHGSSQAALTPQGVAEGFRVEDLLEVDATVARGEAPATDAWLRRRLGPEPILRIDERDGPPRLRALFARRGVLPTSERKTYVRANGLTHVEAFELHVVEHCNLRCAHCCNMSPYLVEHTLTVDAIERMCRTMARHLEVDVFKIMGGEPLLHPDIAGALRAIRRSGISRTVRLFTNGLLLHRMTDAFWEALDELTISTYASAPVKPAHLEAARDKARAFDVVLNVKPVGEFSEVMRAEREPDDLRVLDTYKRCWLRHRCLVVRRGTFFMCTRAAYAPEFHRALLYDAYPVDRDAAIAGDGVPLDHPRFGEALVEYMNRTHPLASCRFCHGGRGPTLHHAQLSKRDVREGRLRPLRILPA